MHGLTTRSTGKRDIVAINCYHCPMKTPLIISALLVANIFLVTPVIAAPDCTCRNAGKDVPEGQSACLQTADGPKIATCARVLNNTSWKITKQSCPVG